MTLLTGLYLAHIDRSYPDFPLDRPGLLTRPPSGCLGRLVPSVLWRRRRIRSDRYPREHKITVPSNPLTLASMFDLIAPLAIYHGADVCYRTRASRAITSLRSAVTQGDPLALQYVGQNHDFEWDLLNSSDLPNDRDVREVYDSLLLALVAEEVDDWDAGYDRSGCRCFRVDGRQLDAFCGDSPNHFAWYETAALVRSRLLDQDGALA